MGREAECTARFTWIGRGRRVVGKALLETDALQFRGGAVAVTLAREDLDLEETRAEDGVLHLRTKEGRASLELGDQAARWAKAILAPPSLLDKLGIKEAAHVAVLGDFEEAFLDELGERAADVAPSLPDADTTVVLLAIGTSRELAAVAKLRAMLAPEAALWVVYPKGKKEPSEAQVLEAGRAAGLKDTKVARFSPTHTALRFVIPVAARSKK